MMWKGWIFGEVQYIAQQLNQQLQMTDKDSSLKNANILSLIRLKAQCKITPIRVDFYTPLLPSATPTSIIPEFNHDGAYFTPSFILPVDKKYYQQNLAFQKCQFEEKIQRCVQQTNAFQSSFSSSEVKIASPHSNYCQICQQKFQDYFIHIHKKTHQIRSTNSEATSQIQLLCQAFQTQQKTHLPNDKTKAIHKQSKREQKPQPLKKLNATKNRLLNKIQRSTKGQNFSTNVPEDSPIQTKE